jgi:hypothetical protein
MNKRTVLTLILLVVCNLIFAQQNNLVYKTDPPNLGKDSEAIVIFQLLSPDEMSSNNISKKAGDNYNKYLKKHAAIYKGKKEFMTTEEIKAIDFSQGNNYKYIFNIHTLKGTGTTNWPYKFAITEIESGISYMANMIYLSNHSKELKKEVKFFEKARKKNAGI